MKKSHAVMGFSVNDDVGKVVAVARVSKVSVIIKNFLSKFLFFFNCVFIILFYRTYSKFL